MKKTTTEKEAICGRFISCWLLGSLVAIICAVCALFGALHGNIKTTAISFIIGMVGMLWSSAVILELSARGYLQKDCLDD